MPLNRPQNYPPIAFSFAVVSVSVSSETSARAAGVGPFAGLFFRTTTSVTIVPVQASGVNSQAAVLTVSDVAANTTLWIAGSYCSVLATATAVFAIN